MQKLFLCLALALFSSCASTQVKNVIPNSEIKTLLVFNQKECNENIIIFDNQEDFDEFQKKQEKSGPRSNPIFTVDFSTKNVAVVCRDNIDGFEIINIEEKRKSSKLNLKKIEGYENNYASTNSILIEIPKTINKLII